MEQSFKKNKPYLENLIDNLKAPGRLKIYLTMKIKFMSSKNRDEERLMHFESMIDNKLLRNFSNHFVSIK